MSKEAVIPNNAPAPLGPYSPAVKSGNMLFLSGQLGIDEADAAAVGDTYNDIPMLERVGHSFIVANAEAHMEEHASWRVPSNNDAGVLALIDAILAAKKASA